MGCGASSSSRYAGDSRAVSEVAEVKYTSDTPVALANFLVSADIRLVRAEYIWSLCETRKLLPRRQEAEHQSFESPSGWQTSLVTHEEVMRWAKGQSEALLCSISHCWETREHPDPCGYQLDMIARASWWYALAYYPAPVWLFIDYTSLFQYKREENSLEDKSFRSAMNAMHVLYCHEYNLTLAIWSLTPQNLWEKLLKDGHKVLIYHEPSGAMKEVTLEELTRNLVEYLSRGWCQAELQWSTCRSDSTAHQRIDKGNNGRAQFRAVMPVRPVLFKKKMQSLKFTHRSDTDAVFHLQKAIFREKVTTCKHALFSHVDEQRFGDLVQALPYYKSMESFNLVNFKCDRKSLMQLCEWLKDRLKQNALTEIVIQFGIENKDQEEVIVRAVAEILPQNSSLTRFHLNIAANLFMDRFPEESALYDAFHDFEAALEKNETLYDVELMGEEWWQQREKSYGISRADFPDVMWFSKMLKRGMSRSFYWTVAGLQERRKGAAVKEEKPRRALRPPAMNQKLVKLLQQNSARSTAELWLGDLGLGAAGARALAGLLEQNSRVPVEKMDLKLNNIRDLGAVALARAIKIQKTVTSIDLRDNSIGDAGAMAFADALDFNTTVQEINLSENNIGDEGAVALANAIQVNRNVQQIHLSKNNIGDAGAVALADAIKINTTVQEILLSENYIRDEGAVALADAIKINRNVQQIHLSKNNIGDEGAMALAYAMKINRTVQQIHLSNKMISDAGAVALADAIKTNWAVQQIHLSNTMISDDGAVALADAIKINKTMTKIDLSRNRYIRKVGKMALREAQQVNQSVELYY